jgi:RNA polymerase sigma-70 factor (ECF subfamily)
MDVSVNIGAMPALRERHELTLAAGTRSVRAVITEVAAAVRHLSIDGVEIVAGYPADVPPPLQQRNRARALGISLSGMKSRVQRGRKRLAELLGQCCALTLDGRGLPMDYEAPPGCDCTGH